MQKYQVKAVIQSDLGSFQYYSRKIAESTFALMQQQMGDIGFLKMFYVNRTGDMKLIAEVRK